MTPDFIQWFIAESDGQFKRELLRLYMDTLVLASAMAGIWLAGKVMGF